MTYDVSFYGIDLTVYYEFHAEERETRDEPGTRPWIEISQIKHKRECIKGLLSDEILDDIEKELNDNYGIED